MGIKNDNRAAVAELALDTYCNARCGARDYSDLSLDDRADAVADLISNLAHLAAQQGFVVATLMQRAQDNFEAEIEGDE